MRTIFFVLLNIEKNQLGLKGIFLLLILKMSCFKIIRVNMREKNEML